MTRPCKKYCRHLVAYLDGELPERMTRQIREHLDRCPDCSRELQELRTAMNALPGFETIAPSPDYDRIFWEKISRIRQEQERGTALKRLGDLLRPWFSPRIGFAASAALAVCIAVVSFVAFRPHNGVPENELQISRDIELFLNMDIIEKSDALEHFELINMLDILEQDVRG